MSDPLADLEALISGMGEAERKDLDKLLEAELNSAFLPNPGPQTTALHSLADILLYGGQAGGGKGLALDTPLPSPSGWTTMGAVAVGDELFDEAGNVCRVTATSAIHSRPCYRVVFDDGSTIVADDVHRWLTFDSWELGKLTKSDPEWQARRRTKRPSRAKGNKSAAFMAAIAKANATRLVAGPPPAGTVRNTAEIAATLTVRNGRRNHAVPLCCSVVGPDLDFQIPPYVLGAWLGDGTSSGGGFTCADPQIVAEIEDEGFTVSRRRHCKGYSFGILKLQVMLRDLGLLKNKHIPAKYLRASVSQRLALLQGLMDTDGTASKNGGCEFDNTNKALIDGVSELLSSLGIKHSVMPRRAVLYGKDCGASYRIGFNTELPIFRLSRKLERMRKPRRTQLFRYIVSCDEIPSVPTKCIQVDGPSSLFLAGFSMVPTHNSALEIGAYFDSHHSGIIFRREGTQLDGLIEFCKQVGEPRFGKFVGGNENVFKRNDGGRLKFAGLKEADDWRKHAGNARDYMAFDEAGEFLREQVMSLIGWLRSTREGQRCRVILGSNPPRGGDGDWLIVEFAPWLDPLFPNPAVHGELRWAIVVAGETEWVDGPGEFDRHGEKYTAMSRTFIPASLNDNPYLKDTGYRAKLQALPEPLRSQLLKGDFLAGRQDDEWQVIPTKWVQLANERWLKAEQKKRRMLALSADVFGGGKDGLAIAKLHEGPWFAPMVTAKADKFSDPTMIPVETAAMMLRERRDEADLSVDGTGGWGSGVRSTLKDNHKIDCAAIVFSAASHGKAKKGGFGFKNLRAEMYWRFREALDPEDGDDIMLPPDARLTAELTAPRYTLKGTDYLLESKEDIIARLGSSPDCGDAVVQAWHRRTAAMRAIAAKAKPKTSNSAPMGADSWMG